MKRLALILGVGTAILAGVFFATRAPKKAWESEGPPPPPPERRAFKALASAETGTFETTFASRSPLGTPQSLAKRLSLTDVPPDYDAASKPFFVYVPKGYQAQKPMGLLVLLNYKPSGATPDAIFPQLADANMAFVVAQEFPDAWPQRAGMALDAVHNLRAVYAIDPRRIYVMGGSEWHADGAESPLAALRMGLCFPDVFAGTISVGALGYRPAPAGGGRYYPPTLSVPAEASLAAARGHPLILCWQGDRRYVDAVAASFIADRFQRVRVASLTQEQFHYPMYTADWLPDFLDYLDAPAAKRDVPTTSPAPRASSTTRSAPAGSR